MAERTPGQRIIRAAAARARNRPTPFYLFDAPRVSANARCWLSAASEYGTDLFYPYKCNRHPALLDRLAGAGLGAEVSLINDLTAALARGIGGERIVVQGPAKGSALLDRALSAGATIVADGGEEALGLLERAGALGRAPRYLLRFRPAAAEPEQDRFGMSARDILAFARRLRSIEAPRPEGLAFHLGTGISSLGSYLAAIREAGEVAEGLRELGMAMATLDAGGGFAAAGEARRDARGRPRGAPPAAPRILRALASQQRRSFPGARLWLEPGRALVSDAFHLVSRVLRVGHRRVYVDASRMSQAFFVPRGKHPFRPIPFRRGRRRRVEIAGPLPVALDVLADGEAIGRPRPGDLLLIGSVGAYNLIAANEWAGKKPEVVEIET